MKFYNATGLSAGLFIQIHDKFFRKFGIGNFENSEIIMCGPEELKKPLGENFRYLVCNMTNTDHLRVPSHVKVISLKGEDLTEVTSTAEHAVYLTMALIKKHSRLDIPGNNLYNKNAYIFGCDGRVGTQLMRILESFGMGVYGSDIEGINEHALKIADFVYLSTSITPDMEPILNSKTIPMLKDGAYIINTSRTQAIDYDVLFEHMDRFGGIGSDFSIPMRFYRTKANIFVTGHVAGYTIEDLKKTSDICFDKLMKLLGDKNENEK